MSWDERDGWGRSAWGEGSGWQGSWWEEQKKKNEKWQRMQSANDFSDGSMVRESLTFFGILSRIQNAYAWEKKVIESGLDKRDLEQFMYNFQATEYWKWFKTAFKHGLTEILFFLLLLPVAILIELRIINFYNTDTFYELLSVFLLFSVNIGFMLFYLYLSRFVVGSLTKRMLSPLVWGRAIPLFIKSVLLVIIGLWLTKENLPPELIARISHYLTYVADKGLTANEIYHRIYDNLPQLRDGFFSAAVAFSLFGVLPILIYKFKKLPEGGYKDWIRAINKKECELDKSKVSDRKLHFGCGIRIYPSLPGSRVKFRPVFQSDAERSTHTDIMGTTGVGKTRLAESLIEQDILMGNSVIVIDPKPDWDLFSRVWSATVEAGRTEEFVFISLLHPHLSSGINPLKFYVYPDEVISTIVSTIQSDDEFFVNIALEMTTLIVNGLYFLHSQEFGRRKEFSYAEILRYISQEGLSRIAQQIEAYKNRSPERVMALLENYKQAINSPTDYFNKVVSTLRTNVANFAHGVVGSIVGKSDDNLVIERLESGKRVICYVMTGAQNFKDKANQLSRVLLAMINNLAGRLNASGVKLPYPLRIHVDEAYTALYHGIEHLFDKARSTGIGLVMYHQSLGQYIEAVGERLTQTIMDNINTFLFMRVTKEETQKFASRMTGMRFTALPTFSVDGHAGMFPNETFRIPPEAFSDLPARVGILVRTNVQDEGYSKVVDLIKTPRIKPPKIRVKPEDLRAVRDEERIVNLLKNYI